MQNLNLVSFFLFLLQSVKLFSCYNPAQQLLVSLEIEQSVQICKIKVTSKACQKSVNIFFDSRRRRWDKHELSRDDCWKENRHNLPNKRLHSDSDPLCRELLEDCPLPDDTSKCKPRWFYGYAMHTCRAYQANAEYSSRGAISHPIAFQEIEFSTSRDCYDHMMKCLDRKKRIPEEMKVENGMLTPRLKEPFCCNRWYLYEPEINQMDCRHLADFEYQFGAWNQEKPKIYIPKYQRRNCICGHN